MRAIQRRQYEMLVRVREFGETRRDLFPESSLGAEALGSVAAAVQQLSEQATSKTAAAEVGKDRKADARELLIEEIAAISRTARGIARETEDFENTFRLPPWQSDQGVLTAGRAFARDAERVKAAFVARGMPETFVDDLRERIEKFEQAARAREAVKDKHTVAQAAIDAALESGIAAAQSLDVIVTNLLRDDPATRGVWERDRRVDYRPKRAKAASPPEPAPQPESAPLPSATGPTGVDVGVTP